VFTTEVMDRRIRCKSASETLQNIPGSHIPWWVNFSIFYVPRFVF